jgi:FkbM family methyltransferase
MKRLIQSIFPATRKDAKTLISEIQLLRKSILRAPYIKDEIFEIVQDDISCKFFLPHASIDFLQTHIFLNCTFFESSLLQLVSERYGLSGKTVLDAGANIGNHSLYFAKIGGAKEVHSFEPQQSLYNILSKNIEINDVGERVIPFRKGLGEQASLGLISNAEMHHLGAGKLEVQPKDSRNPRAIEIVTVDSLDTSFDFLKIDVEGMALNVLKGARETITNYKPVIWVEMFKTEAPEILPLMKSMNYEMVEKIASHDYLFEAR